MRSCLADMYLKYDRKTTKHDTLNKEVKSQCTRHCILYE